MNAMMLLYFSLVIVEILSHEDKIFRPTGSNLTLKCIVKGVPLHHFRPKMKWQLKEARNGTYHDISDSVEVVTSSRTSELIFTGVNAKNHNGEYICMYEARANGFHSVKEYSGAVELSIQNSKY
jgi:hypothetical protein